MIDAEGKLIQKFGESGSREGQLDDPEGIDWSHNGRLYVADKGNNRVSVFGLDGVFIKALGQAGLEEEQRLEDPVQAFVDDNPKHPLVSDAQQVIVELADSTCQQNTAVC